MYTRFVLRVRPHHAPAWMGWLGTCVRADGAQSEGIRGRAADAEVVSETLCDAQRCVEQRRIVEPGHRVVRERLPPVVATSCTMPRQCAALHRPYQMSPRLTASRKDATSLALGHRSSGAAGARQSSRPLLLQSSRNAATNGCVM